MKQFQNNITRTPIRREKQGRQNSIEFLRSKDTPELFNIEGHLSQYQNSSSKWNQQMTPVQINQEGFLKIQNFNNKRTPDIYENKRNSAMTDLIKSATREKDQIYSSKLINESSLVNFYIPEENYNSKINDNLLKLNQTILKEEDYNNSFNSALENDISQKNIEINKKQINNSIKNQKYTLSK